MAKRRRLKKRPIIIALLILAFIVFIISFSIKNLFKNNNGDSSSVPFGTSSEFSYVESSEEELPLPYKSVEISKSKIYEGDLVLVNYNHYYKSDAPSDLVPLFEKKTDSYTVKDNELKVREKIVSSFNNLMDDFVKATNLKNVMVLSGHRTIEYQQMLYDKELKRTGKTDSDEVAKPGESEHHTGLVVDLATVDSDTSDYFDGLGDYAWVNENCHKYGFIVRYPESKKDVTKIVYEPWHYRYVGKVHATVMKENNLCLEEYIDFLKKYPFNGNEHYVIDVDGDKYEIYYIPAISETVEVFIPKSNAYEISGNNSDGFIVTVKMEDME